MQCDQGLNSFDPAPCVIPHFYNPISRTKRILNMAGGPAFNFGFFGCPILDDFQGWGFFAFELAFWILICRVH